jgi:hypothetical protein
MRYILRLRNMQAPPRARPESMDRWQEEKPFFDLQGLGR